MWDFKLFFLKILFFLIYTVYTFFFHLIDIIEPFLMSGLDLLNWNFNFLFPRNMTFFFGIKFCLCISFLILIRGGTPRYRYDYLTKLGWLKFLSFILLVFFFSLLLFFLF